MALNKLIKGIFEWKVKIENGFKSRGWGEREI